FPPVVLIALMHAGLSLAAHAAKFDVEDHEYFWASQMAEAFNLAQSASEQPLWLTNLLQIASMMPMPYLAQYEEKFLRYGKNAGFTNSLLEKYILLPPEVKGPRAGDGDIMLITGKPLKKRNGKSERVCVSKHN